MHTRKQLSPYEMELIARALRAYATNTGTPETAKRLANAFEESERVTVTFHGWDNDRRAA